MHLQAVTRAPDGQLLENGRDFYARTEAALPSAERAAPRRSEAVDRGARGAPRARPRIDPVHRPRDPRARGDRACCSTRRSATGSRASGVDDDKEGQTYKGQVGQRILPRFLSIVDDPTLARRRRDVAERQLPLRRAGRAGAAHRARRGRSARDATSCRASRCRPFERSNGHGRSQGARSPIGADGEPHRRVAARRCRATS